MRSMRTVFAVIALLALLTTGCADGAPISGPLKPVEPSPVAAVIVEPTTAILVVGTRLTAAATPVDAAGNSLTGRSVRWSTSNPAVAPVSTAGEVTASSPGTATIVATSGFESGLLVVTVTPVPVASVTVTPDSGVIVQGSSIQFAAAPADSARQPLTDRLMTWSTSAPQIVSVSQNGLVTALTPGSALIVASSEGRSDTASVRVTPIPVAAVSLAPTALDLRVGQTGYLTATARDANGNVLSNQSTSWSSSNSGVAGVASNGMVTALSIGSATITATVDGVSATASVAVSEPAPSSVLINPTSASVVVGSSTQLTAEVRDANGNIISGATIEWSTSDGSVATVSASGLVSGVAPGSATITAASSGMTATASITVTRRPVEAVAVTPSSASLLVGQTAQLTATATDANGQPLTGHVPTWASSNSAVASVSSTGLVTAIGPGTAVITATIEGKVGSATVTVALVPVATVTITPAVDTILVGEVVQLTAVTRDAAGNLLTGRTIAWTNSSETIATLSSTGAVLGKGQGSVTITATSEGISGTAAVIVQPQPVASVTVTPATAEIMLGATVQLTATPKDAHGNALAGREVVWSTSNAAVATVSAFGLVTGVAAGTATITATSEGQSGTSSITVTAPPPSTWLYPGDNLQAKINAHPAGTTFLVKAGVHRLQEIVPRTGDTFVGESGAILSGATLLTAFTREGAYWVVTGQTQGGSTNTFTTEICSSTPRCRAPQDLFIDDAPLHHVGSLAEVGPGKWYFDYVADKIYFADDPTGRKVETSIATFAFTGAANNVTIRGLVVEKFATPPQLPAIFPGVWQQPGGADWVIEDNEIRWNHASGVSLNTRVRIARNFIHHNGEMGIGGTGSSVHVEDNEIAFNNYNVWYNWLWEGGGTKFVKNNGLTLRGNHVHDNHGPGLWTDHDNINVVFEGNRIENNEGPGIFHEISCDAVIRDNVVRNSRSWANIYISNSRNTEVYGNTIEGHGILGNVDNRTETGVACTGALVVENLWVHDNVLTLTSAQMGLQQQVGDTGFFTSRNNRFTANHYDVANPAGAYWKWMNGDRAWSQWQSYGQDVSGSVK